MNELINMLLLLVNWELMDSIINGFNGFSSFFEDFKVLRTCEGFSRLPRISMDFQVSRDIHGLSHLGSPWISTDFHISDLNTVCWGGFKNSTKYKFHKWPIFQIAIDDATPLITRIVDGGFNKLAKQVILIIININNININIFRNGVRYYYYQ